MTIKKSVSHLLLLLAMDSLGLSNAVKEAPYLELNGGGKIPHMGLGTWLGYDEKGPVKPVADEVAKAVAWAIDLGYRLIDTAHIYDTEVQVGQAVRTKIEAGVVEREDLFIVTKLWNDRHAQEAVVPALRQSLAKLGLTYVDLYLIHWPVGQFGNGTFDNTDYLETWKGMVQAKKLGLTKHIGISNFNKQQLIRLLRNTNESPSVLQIEINLNLQQPELRAYCKHKGIAVMAYTPFGSLFPNRAPRNAPSPRIDDPVLVNIAKKYNKTVPQIVLRYLVQLGVIPIPKTINYSRLEENLNIFDYELPTEDKRMLGTFEHNYRTIPVKMWQHSPYYPFEKD